MKYKIFRLFVSSTFNDFKEEREILHREVLPQIRDFCHARGYDFQMIDLRWGIYSEATLNHKTLPICINEVKRCKDFSPRPNFLAMVGERYGWIPLPPFIAKEEFTRVAEELDEREKSALAEWYLYDDNEIGGQFYLRARDGLYADDALWSDKESELRELLIKGATRAGLDERDLIKYTASATEHEILNGLFTDEATADSNIVVLRSGHPSKDPAPEKINSLKQRIFDYMQTSHTTDNLIELSYGDGYKTGFSVHVTNLLLKLIAHEMERLEDVEDEQARTQRLLPYYNGNSVYLGHESALAAIEEYVSGSSHGTMFLTGDSGCGKTTLLAKFLSEYDGASTFVFYGENAASCSISEAIGSIALELHDKYRPYDPRPEDTRNLAEDFCNAIALVPRRAKTHLIVIDGIDMFWDLPLLKEKFIPSKLPENVKIIISSAKQDVVLKLGGVDDVCLNLDGLTSVQGLACFEQHIKNKHRRIQSDEQTQAAESALGEGCTPLQAKLLADLASTWRSNDICNRLPKTSEEAALEYIRNAYETFGHDRDTVLYCLALISSAPLGLTEQDILSMLPKFDSVRQNFVREMKHDYDLSYMPYAIWLRLFFDLKDCLEISFYDGESIVRFSHNVFLNVMKKFFPQYCEETVPVLLQYLNEHSTVRASAARMELTLLMQHGYTDKLAELLTDTEYVSACVKHGYVNDLIEKLSALLPLLHGTHKYDRARRMLRCIIQNRRALSRYRTEFYRCAYEHGLSDGYLPDLELLTPIKDSADDGKVLPVFYSADAKFSWAPDGKAYAVYERSYVYICDAVSRLEKARIYLGAEKDARLQARDVIWLSLDMIAVITYQNELLLYQISGELPTKLYSAECDEMNSAVSFREDGSFIYCDKGNVVSFDIANRRVNYKIPFAQENCVCISDDGNSVIVRTQVLNKRGISYSVYDVKTGEIIKTTYAENKEIRSCKTEMFSVANNRLLQIYTDLGYYGFLLQNFADGSYVFLHPPKYKEIKQIVVGRRFLICVYENFVFAVDLEDLSAKRLSLNNITDVAWILRDESISVWTREYELTEFSLADMESVGKAFADPLNLFGGTIAAESAPILSSMISIAKILPRGNAKEYCAFFNTWYDEYEETGETEDLTVPSLLAVAENGIKAQAYEYQNAVAVLSEDNEPLFWIENLFLSVDNNILGFSFSHDSRYLLIWTNLFVRVISVATERIILNLSVKRRPVKLARFSRAGRLQIAFVDGKVHEATLSDRGARFDSVLPRMLYAPDYVAAYYNNPLQNMRTVYNIFDEEKIDRFTHASKWVDHTRRYYGETQWLLYQNGRFYLNGDLELGFKNSRDYDFKGAAEDCVLSCASSLETYVFEKNDLFYALYEFDAQKKLLLICKKTNSVILFDIDKMEIVSAYMPAKKIIGHSINKEQDRLTLFLDSASNTASLKINL